MSLALLAAVAVFIAVGAATMVVQSVVGAKHQVYRSLRSVRSIELTPNELRSHALAKPISERVLMPGIKKVGAAVSRLTPGSVVARLSLELAYAGSPAGWDAERVLAFKALGAGSGAVGSIAMVAGLGMPGSRIVLLMPILAILGYYVPEWVLRSKSGKRQALLQRALPDALDLLSITVEAGLGFDAALARVAKQASGPLAEELHRVLQEMQIGVSRADALRDLAERNTVEELKAFVLAMVQADVFGISIGKVLHVQAHEMRLKRRQRAEEKAMKTPVKIIFPLIACIFPALFVVLLGPAVITIYKTLFHH